MAAVPDLAMRDLSGEDDDSLSFGRTRTYCEQPSSEDPHEAMAPLEYHHEAVLPNQEVAQAQPDMGHDVGSLLLKKPSTVRTNEPGEGFKYGPATRISAANFSRMPPKPLRTIPFPDNGPPWGFMRAQSGTAQESHTLGHHHEGDFGITSPNSELHSAQTVGLRESPPSGFWVRQRVHYEAQGEDSHQDDAPTSAQRVASSGILMSFIADSFAQHTPAAEEPEPPVNALQSRDGDEGQIDEAPDEVETHDIFFRSMTPTEHVEQGKPRHLPLSDGVVDLEYTDRAKAEEKPGAQQPRSHPLAVPFPNDRDLLRRPRNILASHNTMRVPEALCRPLKEFPLGNSSTMRRRGARPPSRASNVSKRRTPPHRYHVSGVSDVVSDTRSVSSYAPTPGNRQAPSAVNFKFVESIAKEINGFIHEKNAELEEKLRDYALYVKRLRKERAELNTAVSRHKSREAEIGRQNQASRDLMAEQIRLLESEVDAATSQVHKIKERYSICKDRLNSALDEQQQLYRRSRKQCEETMQKMQEMEKSQSTLVELTTQRTDEIREKMSEKVRQVVEQSKAEIQILQEQITSIQRQLGEKTSELANEQTTVRILSEKLKDAQALSTGFDRLMSQNKDVLEKLEEQIRSKFEQDQIMESQAKERFDAVKKHLNELSELTSSHSQDLEGVSNAYRASIDSLISKLDIISNSQNTTCEFIENLPTEVEAHALRILDKLESREDINQRLQEKSEENGMLSTLFKQAEQRSTELEAELDAMKRDAEEQDTQIRSLEEKLFVAEQAQNKCADDARKLIALESNTDRLERELQSANAVARGLQDKLHMKEEAFTSEIRRLTAIVDQHNQMVQQREAIARAESEKAVEITRREGRIELEKVTAEAKKSLQQMEKTRDYLSRELETLRETLCEKERGSSAQAATINELKEALNSSASRQTAMAAEINGYCLKLSQSKQMESERVTVLEAQLAESNELASQLRDAVTQQRMKAETFTEVLNTWTREMRIPDEVLRELNTLASENVSVEKIEASLHRVLDGIAVALRNTRKPDIPDCPVLVEPDNESSRFFPNSRSQLSRREPVSTDELSQPSTATIDSQSTLDGPLSFEFNGSQEPQHLAPPLGRRVVVRTPANEQTEPNPPSIAEEKESRRTAPQPKPIIKQASQTETQDGSVLAYQPNGELPGPTSLSGPTLKVKRPQKLGKTARTRTRTNQTTSESSARGRSKRKHVGEADENNTMMGAKMRKTTGQIKSSIFVFQTENLIEDDEPGYVLNGGQGCAHSIPSAGNSPSSVARNTKSRSAQAEDQMVSGLDSQGSVPDSKSQSSFRSQHSRDPYMFPPSERTPRS